MTNELIPDMEPLTPTLQKEYLTAEEYGDIYSVVVNTMQRGLDEANDKYAYMTNLTNNGFIAIFENNDIQFPEYIREKIKLSMEKLMGVEVEHVGIMFARYTWDSAMPTLMPHCDRAMPSMAITNTIALDQTKHWDIYVEDQKFDIKTNDVLWFSGSHQVHWRPDSKFEKDDYYDILLCQTFFKGDTNLLPESHFEAMDKKSSEYMDKYKDLLTESLSKVYDVDGCQ